MEIDEVFGALCSRLLETTFTLGFQGTSEFARTHAQHG
jgi:hypothetical protein